MWIIDKLFKKENKKKMQIENVPNEIEDSISIVETPCAQKEYGHIELIELKINLEIMSQIKESFIAVDTETNGLGYSAKIVEISACKFENSQLIESYSSLINSVDFMPNSAERVNHISIDMIKSAPNEETVYKEFVDFIGDALSGTTILCAHNGASFDMPLIKKALESQGYQGEIRFVDTLKLAREYLGLYNNKQITIMEHYGIEIDNLHRAESDAEGCGIILLKMLDDAKTVIEKNSYYDSEEYKMEKESWLSDEEKELCAIIQSIVKENGRSTKDISFSRGSSGIVSADIYCSFLRFKLAKTKKYIIVKKNRVPEGYNIEPVSKAEGYDQANEVRMLFESPKSFRDISEFILESYDKVSKNQYWHLHNAQCMEYYKKHSYFLDPMKLSLLEELAYKRYDDYVNEKRKIEEQKLQSVLESERLRIQKRLEREEKLRREKEEKEKNRKESNFGRRPIRQMNLDGSFVADYDSLSDAIKATGINSKSIRSAEKGLQKHAGGYLWKYLDKEDNKVE